MPRVKGTGKRELKKQTKANIAQAFQDTGIRRDMPIHVELKKADSKLKEIYGDAGDHVAALSASVGMPDDATVEDVSPFRRGFQWAIHIKSPSSVLISMIAEACTQAGADRLSRTQDRRELEASRAEKREARETKKAEERRDWKSA